MPKPILSQPRATRGKTVGRAVIKSFIHDIQHGAEPGFKPLYTQNRFNQMVEGLGSEREYNIYLGYVAVFNGLSEELVRSQAYAQQAQHGLLHLQIMLSEVRRAEKAKGFFEDVSSLFTSLEDIGRDAMLQQTIRAYHDDLLMPALRGLAAYDALIGLLAAHLEISEMEALKAQAADLTRDLAEYNADIAAARAEIANPLLGELFQPIAPEDTQPAPGAIEAVKAALSEHDVLPSGIVQRLFVRLLEG